jgi:hypothetical protein
VLPPVARFCARCGSPLGGGAPGLGEPVWVVVLLWLGAAGLVVVAMIYGSVASGLVAVAAVTPGNDPATVRTTAAVFAVGAASLAVAHVAAAVGLMGRRTWARPLATLVCVSWGLTCVGLPVGLLAINAIWRARQRR